MDNPKIETRTHFLLRLSAWVAAIDTATFTVAAVACWIIRSTLTLYDFSNSLCICGFIVILLAGSHDGSEFAFEAGYAEYLESKVPSQHRLSAFPSAALFAAGLIALISSIALPLAFNLIQSVFSAS